MRIFVALAALLTAAPTTPQHNTATSTVFPPPRFHDGQVAAVTFMLNDVQMICGRAPIGYRIVACVRSGKEGTVLAMPNPCSPEFIGERYAHVACHEKAHLLGWSRMHEE